MFEMINILGPFYEATLLLGGSKFVTISLVYPLIEALKKKYVSSESHEEPEYETTEDAFDGNAEYADDSDENDINVNEERNKKKRKIKINSPQNMIGLADLVKSHLFKYLNYYWKNPTAEELITCVLDPRVKKLEFTTTSI